MRRLATRMGSSHCASHGQRLVGAPNGSDPSFRMVCQKATLKRSHSFMVLPATTSLSL